MKQQFQLVLPVTFQTGAITITPESSLDEVFNITGATRYNNRRNSSTSSDLWAYVEDRLDTASFLFGWTISEQPTGIKGKTRIVSTSASEWCDEIELPLNLALALGFEEAVIPSNLQTGGGALGNKLSYFDAPNRCKGLYIPEPVDEVFYNPFSFRTKATILTSQSPRGALTSASYGSTRYRDLQVLFVRGYSAKACYVDNDFGNHISISTTDPNISFEEWVQYWNNIGGAARLYLDVNDLSDYKTVYPDLQESWWADPDSAFSLVSEAPLRYEMNITLIEAV